MIHVMYPTYTDERGVVFQCCYCERKMVRLQSGNEVTLNEGLDVTHEVVEPIESFDFPQEFEELLSKKGWE